MTCHPLLKTSLTLPNTVALALSANRWQLTDLFALILTHLSSRPFPDATSLQPAAKLLTISQTSSRFRLHLRSQLANCLSHSLQATFPNSPTSTTSSLLQTFHNVNDLVAPLALAARHSPFLPLLHGVFAALESLIDDVKLATYVHALPVASAGIIRVFSCDAATARWPARAVRIAAAVATAASGDVARASIAVRVGGTTSVALSPVQVSLSATRDAKGVAASVYISHSKDGGDVSLKEDWGFARIGVRGAPCTCACGGLVEGGGDVIFEKLDADNLMVMRSSVVRFDGEAIDRWTDDHVNCGEMMLSIEVQLMKGSATIFIRGKGISNTQSDDYKSSGHLVGTAKGTSIYHPGQGPSLDTADGGRRNSGSTSMEREERSGNAGAVWLIGL